MNLLKNIVVIALLVSVITAIPFLAASSIKPTKSYGEITVEYALYDNNTLEIGVRSWGTGAPVRIDYIVCVYEWGVDRVKVDMMLKYYNRRVIRIHFDNMPRYVIIHYIDVWNNEERLTVAEVSNIPRSQNIFLILEVNV